MSRALSQHQFTCRTHASLQKVSTVSGPVRASHYCVRMHLRLSILESDVANQRKQFHLLVENAGGIILFRLPVEPTQPRGRKSADGFEATTRKPWLFANCRSPPAISSPVAKIRTKVFGSSSICFHRVTSPFLKTVSDLRKQEKHRQLSCTSGRDGFSFRRRHEVGTDRIWN